MKWTHRILRNAQSASFTANVQRLRLFPKGCVLKDNDSDIEDVNHEY